jgi:hypothetical protein
MHRISPAIPPQTSLPDATRLRELLDAPQVRAALPPQLLARDPPSNWVEGFKKAFLAQGYIWLGSGVLLLFAVVLPHFRRNLALLRDR